LQRLQQLGNSSNSAGKTSPAAAPPTPAQSPAQAPAPTAVPAPAAAADTDHMPCPYFRVSFVSVPAECIQEGFLRLRAAILSCHGPKTPPGEETELASCSSSIGCHSSSHAVGAAAGAQGCGMAAAAATASVGDSAMC
jgi:hypothetical protein